MSDIVAGVVLVTQFVVPGSAVYKKYINYMDRDEAIRNEYMEQFNVYNDYMGNPEKSSGIFTRDYANMSESELDEVKSVFKVAQENDSLMWQTVISFDNRWLEECGMYDSELGYLNEMKLQSYVRATMDQLLEKENLQNAYWSGSIHYNTDNIHVHLATVEPVPMREKIQTGYYAGQYKGKFAESSLRSAKSIMVNKIFDQSHINTRITDIMRNKIIAGIKDKDIGNDKLLLEQYMKIHSKLPYDKRKWKYGNNAMKDLRPELDKLSAMYIKEYHEEDYEELTKLLQQQNKVYSESYGKNAANKSVDNKIDDLYRSMGNSILGQLKNLDKEMKSYNYERIQQEQKSVYTKEQDEEEEEYDNYYEEEMKKTAYRSEDLKGYKYQRGRLSFTNKTTLRLARRSLQGLKKTLKKDFKHEKNINTYIKTREKEMKIEQAKEMGLDNANKE